MQFPVSMTTLMIDPEEFDDFFKKIFDKIAEQDATIKTYTKKITEIINNVEYEIEIEFYVSEEKVGCQVKSMTFKKTKEQLLEEYKNLLSDCVKKEQYEQAAIYRDMINNLIKNG